MTRTCTNIILRTFTYMEMEYLSKEVEAQITGFTFETQIIEATYYDSDDKAIDSITISLDDDYTFTNAMMEFLMHKIPETAVRGHLAFAHRDPAMEHVDIHKVDLISFEVREL